MNHELRERLKKVYMILATSAQQNFITEQKPKAVGRLLFKAIIEAKDELLDIINQPPTPTKTPNFVQASGDPVEDHIQSIAQAIGATDWVMAHLDGPPPQHRNVLITALNFYLDSIQNSTKNEQA